MMTKRVPSRNGRSKGIKFKHILQICVLLGVSFWLIYQVKHSHDKKKEFDEKDVRVSTGAHNGDEILKFGRKDLHPRVPELRKNGKHEEDDEEENEGREEMNKKEKVNHEQDQEEEEDEEEIKHIDDIKHEESKHDEEFREDENKQEEEEHEEEIKDEEAEDEGREGGDDGIDEHYKGQIEGDVEHEIDFLEEEKEIEEEGEEKEIENNEAEDKELQVDHGTSLEDHEDNAHEAREEHYKADDASSAVAQDSTITSTEPRKWDADTSMGNSERSDLEEENKSVKKSEAGEEHYKEDSASSAVTHDNPIKNSELDRAGSENANESLATNDTVQETKLDGNIDRDVIRDQTNTASQLKQDVTAESVPSDENNHGKISLPNAYGKSPENTSVPSDESNKLIEMTVSTGGKSDASSSSQMRETLNNTSIPTEAQKATIDGATPLAVSSPKLTDMENADGKMVLDSRQLPFNLSVSHETDNVEANGKGSSNSSNNFDSNAFGQTIKPDVAADAEVDSESSMQIKEIAHPAIDVNSGNDSELGGKDDTSSSSTKDITGVADTREHVDSSDNPIDQSVNDASIDLGTSPKDDVEGVNSRNAASE